MTLLAGDERLEMKAGDYVCFPAGRKVGHSFMNRGPGPCSYLMIGEHDPNDVCVYPASNKMAVNALRTAGLDFRHVGREDLLGRRGYGIAAIRRAAASPILPLNGICLRPERPLPGGEPPEFADMIMEVAEGRQHP